jgi:hypothetical protein
MVTDSAMPVLPRTRFNRSPLIRCLEGLGVAGVAESGQTVAERLGPWLDWTGAIALFNEMQGGPATSPCAGPPSAGAGAGFVIEEFHRTRRDLARSITTDTAFTDAEIDASTGRRHHLAQQRAMEARLVPLRAKVRAALSAFSPDLRQLAALDALLESALGARERHLLSTVPALMERHTGRLREGSEATPAADRRPMRSALLAELDMRLQPIEGMIEALGEAVPKDSHGSRGAHE